MGKNHPNVDDYVVSRVRAIESLLLEKGLLAPDAVETAVRLIQALPADMKTSMQLDYERRARVELEDITGAVVRLGRRLGVPTPAYDVAYAVLRVRAAAFGGLGPPEDG